MGFILYLGALILFIYLLVSTLFTGQFFAFAVVLVLGGIIIWIWSTVIGS
jgi:hypothetical protein